MFGAVKAGREKTFDVIVVGAGHNGLVCACYLARAGRRVLVIERRPVVGGAVCTEEIVPGFRFDTGSSVHIMFRMTPIMEELELAGAGLEYIELDPWAFHPVAGAPGGGIAFYRDVERTCESIAGISGHDARAYRQFVAHWGEINEGVFEVFLKPPTPRHLVGTMLRRNLFRPKSRKLWSSAETVRQLMGSYGGLIQNTFESGEMRAAMTWLAAQSGPPPDEMATGDFAGWQAMIHKHGAWRARGGSGALTQALARRLESLGGEILTNAPVERISRGARGLFEVRAGEQAYCSRQVVAACHVQTLFGSLLDESLVSPTLASKVSRTRVGNGFGMIVRHAVDELPIYDGIQTNAAGIAPCHSAMQLLVPSRSYLDAAYHDYLRGQPPKAPCVLAMTFSAIDPTLAPPGKHTLFTWAQYHPYQLADGLHWDSIAEREADKLYEVVCQRAPNMRGKLLDRLIQTPLDLERRFGLLRGNVMHLEMGFDQMFAFRPLPELSSYTTPIDGLFLTGASTHPGGGVFGASGRNTAMTMLGKG